jgi:hypothetical protein
MSELLAFFFMYHFNAEWGWWIAFGFVLGMEGYCKGREREKLNEFLANSKKEFKIREEERKAKEPHIYLGGMLDD